MGFATFKDKKRKTDVQGRGIPTLKRLLALAQIGLLFVWHKPEFIKNLSRESLTNLWIWCGRLFWIPHCSPFAHHYFNFIGRPARVCRAGQFRQCFNLDFYSCCACYLGWADFDRHKPDQVGGWLFNGQLHSQSIFAFAGRKPALAAFIRHSSDRDSHFNPDSGWFH